jgi:hypothetical protein
MALVDLVNEVRRMRYADPKIAELTLEASARLVLRKKFGVDPSDAEVIELAEEVMRTARENREFFHDWDFEEDAKKNEWQRQTRGGKEIVYKSEYRAG